MKSRPVSVRTSMPPRRRFVLIFVLATLGLVVPGPSAGHAEDTGNSTLDGKGFFVRSSLDPRSQEDLLTFHCAAMASPDTVATWVSTCRLIVESDWTLASAPPRALPGPAAATTGSILVDVSEVSGPFSVCWEVGALFLDAEVLTEEGCGFAPPS